MADSDAGIGVSSTDTRARGDEGGEGGESDSTAQPEPQPAIVRDDDGAAGIRSPQCEPGAGGEQADESDRAELEQDPREAYSQDACGRGIHRYDRDSVAYPGSRLCRCGKVRGMTEYRPGAGPAAPAHGLGCFCAECAPWLSSARAQIYPGFFGRGPYEPPDTRIADYQRVIDWQRGEIERAQAETVSRVEYQRDLSQKVIDSADRQIDRLKAESDELRAELTKAYHWAREHVAADKAAAADRAAGNASLIYDKAAPPKLDGTLHIQCGCGRKMTIVSTTRGVKFMSVSGDPMRIYSSVVVETEPWDTERNGPPDSPAGRVSADDPADGFRRSMTCGLCGYVWDMPLSTWRRLQKKGKSPMCPECPGAGDADYVAWIRASAGGQVSTEGGHPDLSVATDTRAREREPGRQPPPSQFYRPPAAPLSPGTRIPVPIDWADRLLAAWPYLAGAGIGLLIVWVSAVMR